MFEFIEAVLAAIGLITVAVLYAMYRDGVFDEAPPPPDPYRDGLDAAARISALGWEAEQAMHRVAEQHRQEKAG